MMRRLIPLLFLLLGAVSMAQAQSIPQAKGFVNDFSNVLNSSEEAQLNAMLTQYAESSANEIAFVIMDLPQDASMEEFTLQIAEKWGVGGKANDNGILVAVYPNARQMRMEVGYGLEGAVPDLRAKDIMDTYMKPAFRAGDYYGGMRDATQAIIAATNGEYENAPTRKYYDKQPREAGKGGQMFVIIMIIILFSIMSRRGGGGKGGGGRGGGGGGMWLPWIFLGGGNHHGGGSSWGGGGGFGGGGGGFGGFGGGGFGGGGASSGW